MSCGTYIVFARIYLQSSWKVLYATWIGKWQRITSTQQSLKPDITLFLCIPNAIAYKIMARDIIFQLKQYLTAPRLALPSQIFCHSNQKI